MKILFLCYRGNPYCGGQGIYLYYLTRELARLGVKIDVLVGPPYPDPLDKWATVYKIENLNLWALKTRSLDLNKLKRIFSPLNFVDYLLTRFHFFPEMETFSFRAFAFLKKLLKEKEYDLIHDVQSLGWGLYPMRTFQIPMITTVHHPLTRDREADLMMDKTLWEKITTILFYPLSMQKFIIKKLDGVITSFQAGIEELHQAFKVKKEKISVVYNGLDVDLFQNDGSVREKKSLLFVGNTEDHKKGIIYLLEALTLLPKEITLTIVDEGPPLKNFAYKLVKKFNLENRVFFTGKVDQHRLVNLYSSKTILVMSSLYEGFGLPAAEAMACKTPVVATEVGALREVVIEGTGLLVPPKNPEALQKAILKIIADEKWQQRLGAKGRSWVVSKFSWPVVAKNTMKSYQRFIRSFEEVK